MRQFCESGLLKEHSQKEIGRVKKKDRIKRTN